MSAFDTPYKDPSGYCLGICNDNADGQLLPSQNRVVESEDQEIDGLLSDALKALTFEELQEQQDFLHGVDRKIAEEATFIEVSLQQLEIELAEIKSGTIYEMAERMDPIYVRARARRIMFLRANRYDVKVTAGHMLRFFQVKHKLFGSRKLVRDITLEDLDEGDIAAVKSGFLQVAGRDRAGRVILLNFPGLRGHVTLQNELRMRYYILNSELENEENQMSHFVAVIFSVGDMKDKIGGRGFFENTTVAQSQPYFLASSHLCTDDVREYLFLVALVKASPLKLRSRIKMIIGSQTECLYQLSTYGIAQDFLPLDPNTQKFSLKRHLEWVESRFAKEMHRRSMPPIIPKQQLSGIINPSDADVLVGTGKTSNNMGNERLRARVKELSLAYYDGSKDARRALVERLVNEVKELGGRFLKEEKDDDWNYIWKEMSRDQSRKNVAQLFRNSYRPKKTGAA